MLLCLGEQALHSLPWQIKKDYQRIIGAVLDRFSRECRMSNIDYVPIDTSMGYDVSLLAFLNKRSKLY